jgi:hypothetical protein
MVCGKKFYTKPSGIAKGYGKYCSKECVGKHFSKSRVGANNPNFGKTASLEARQKMIASNKGEKHINFGKHHSAETKLKMSISLTGDKNPNFGKPKSDETKQKMRDAHLGIPCLEETKRKISISMRKRQK